MIYTTEQNKIQINLIDIDLMNLYFKTTEKELKSDNLNIELIYGKKILGTNETNELLYVILKFKNNIIKIKEMDKLIKPHIKSTEYLKLEQFRKLRIE